MHILIHLLTFYRFFDQKKRLEELALTVEEFRMVPVPYGLLAHELIEVID
jgi:hypothetical protein